MTKYVDLVWQRPTRFLACGNLLCDCYTFVFLFFQRWRLITPKKRNHDQKPNNYGCWVMLIPLKNPIGWISSRRHFLVYHFLKSDFLVKVCSNFKLGRLPYLLLEDLGSIVLKDASFHKKLALIFVVTVWVARHVKPSNK